MREVGSLIILVVLIAATVGVVSSFFLEEDNTIEEACEKIIEVITGNEVDLTEDSPEVKNDQKT